MSIRSAFAALRVSASSLPSSSRSFSSSASVRALDAHVYASHLSKATTAEELSQYLSERGVKVTDARLLASDGTQATGSGLLSVVSQDDVRCTDLIEAVQSLNLDARDGMSGLQGEFRVFLPADSPASDLATPSKDTLMMLNLPDSITSTEAARTLVYYNAYTEARSVKIVRATQNATAEEDENDTPLEPMTRRTGAARIRAGDEERTKKLLSFTGQVFEGNEIVVFPELNLLRDPYQKWQQTEEQSQPVAE